MATTPDPAVKRMEKLLECCFCTETLTNPRTLSCFHSFCHHCLERFVATRREDAVKTGTKVLEMFECPICRTKFKVKKNESVKNIPSNFFINNMLELLTLQQQAQCIKCQSCKAKDPATSRCVSCDNYLCAKCLETHSNWPAFENHVVLTMEELAKPENRVEAGGKPRCEKHNKVLKFYCETCKALVCRYCMDLNHPRPEHSWFPLADIVEQKKESLKTSSAIFEKQMNDAAKSKLEIEHAMETLKNNATKAKDAIMQQQEEILNTFTKMLEGQTTVLLDQVDMKFKEVNKPLMKQQVDMKDYLEKAKSSLDFAKNIISNGTDEEILSLKDEVEEKAEGIVKERPKLMDPLHNGAIEYQKKSSKIVVENVNLNELGKIVSPALIKHGNRGQVSPVSREAKRKLVDPILQSLLDSSTILDGNIEYAKQLEDWIEDKAFGWKLCYRATVDGWQAENFHRKCNGIGPTVIVIKCETNVFGGYTDRSWEDSFGEYKRSKQCFLFSLRNKDNLKPFKCPIYDRRNDKAIWCDSTCGAIFGGGHDLLISSDANTNQYSYANLGNTYRPPRGYETDDPRTRALLAGSYKFTPTEIEVFRRLMKAKVQRKR